VCAVTCHCHSTAHSANCKVRNNRRTATAVVSTDEQSECGFFSCKRNNHFGSGFTKRNHFFLSDRKSCVADCRVAASQAICLVVLIVNNWMVISRDPARILRGTAQHPMTLSKATNLMIMCFCVISSVLSNGPHNSYRHWLQASA
jgi:hypothetical protein